MRKISSKTSTRAALLPTFSGSARKESGLPRLAIMQLKSASNSTLCSSQSNSSNKDTVGSAKPAPQNTPIKTSIYRHFARNVVVPRQPIPLPEITNSETNSHKRDGCHTRLDYLPSYK